MPNNTYSRIWEYFERQDDDYAICKACRERTGKEITISASKGSTGAMNKHLKAIHPKLHSEMKSKMGADRTDQDAKKTKREQATVEAKSQLSIQSCFISKITKLTINDPKSRAIDRAIVEMIALDDQPFSMVENLGFMRFMKQIAPEYNLKSRTAYKQQFLAFYETVRAKIQLYIENCAQNGISFTTDIWSNETEALFSLTAHAINDEFQRIKFVLHAEPMTEERHTSENLGAIISKMFENWNIPTESVHVILRDSAANIKKAIKDLEFESASCTAHQLNLVVNDAIGKQFLVKKTIGECKKIVGLLNRSDPARKTFKTIQKEIDSEKSPLKLLQDVPTRWNSTLLMLERIYSLREAVDMLCQHDFKIENRPISEITINWSIVSQIIELLSPFKDITEELSSSSSSLADVIPRINYLGEALLPENKQDEFGVRTFANQLRSSLGDRFKMLEENELLAVSTLLDPRYKNRVFKQVSTLEKTITKICNIIEATGIKRLDNKKRTNKKIIESQKQKRLKFDDYLAAISSSEGSEAEDMDENPIKKEIMLYLKEKRVNSDPLLYWKARKMEFPLLTQVARRFLAAPATSVPSEQLFSGAGIVYSPKRNRLSGETVEKLLFLKYNLPEINFKY